MLSFYTTLQILNATFFKIKRASHLIIMYTYKKIKVKVRILLVSQQGKIWMGFFFFLKDADKSYLFTPKGCKEKCAQLSFPLLITGPSKNQTPNHSKSLYVPLESYKLLLSILTNHSNDTSLYGPSTRPILFSKSFYIK